MDRLLSLEVTVLLLLVVASVFVRFGVIDSSAQPIQTDPQQSIASTENIHTEPSQTTQPSETVEPTQPPLKLTFSEDFTLDSRDYFVYDCGEENVMAMSGDPDARVYPASVTKLFTAHVALKYLDPDTVVKLGEEVNLVAADSSLAYLKKGQRISVERLVEGMLLPSGNDAAYAIAVAAAKSYSGNSAMETRDALAYFVDLMNAEAQALGMTGSHFANPDGYHNADHYTSCADLITIARLALENELICKYASMTEDRVKFSNGDLAVWSNTNALIDPESQYYHEDAIGLKTGSTSHAGFCVLSAFKLNGEYIIVGSFGCQRPEGRFIDALKLYDLVVQAKTE